MRHLLNEQLAGRAVAVNAGGVEGGNSAGIAEEEDDVFGARFSGGSGEDAGNK